MGVTLAHPEASAGPQKLRTIGRVVVDDTRLYRLNAATDGWMQEVRNRSVGSSVVEAKFWPPTTRGTCVRLHRRTSM